jgi:hypothetical protein
MKNEVFPGCRSSQDSANPSGVNLVASPRNRPPGVNWGLFLLATVAGFAVFTGGTVIAEVTPTYIRMEINGK